jgi:hypothetical protein
MVSEMRAALEAFDEGESFRKLWKEGFLGLELSRVDTPAQAAHLDWMFEVEHFVIQKILQGVART